MESSIPDPVAREITVIDETVDRGARNSERTSGLTDRDGDRNRAILARREDDRRARVVE